MLHARLWHVARTRTHFMLRMIVVFVWLVQQIFQYSVIVLIIRIIIRIILAVFASTRPFDQQVSQSTRFGRYGTVILGLDGAASPRRRVVHGTTTVTSRTSALVTLFCSLDSRRSGVTADTTATIGADTAGGIAQRGRLRGLLKRTEGERITEGMNSTDRGRTERS